MRKRIIDPSIWADENFGKLSNNARVLFIGLISNADDDGYLRASDSYLRSTIFMYDDTPLTNVRQWADELQTNLPSVHFYEVDGNRFVHLKKWETYQNQREDRRVKSTLPKCIVCHPINQMSDTPLTKDGQLPAEVSKLSKEVKLSKLSVTAASGGRLAALRQKAHELSGKPL